MTTTLLLIRHGVTDWNIAQRWQGHADIPLNKTGQQQAEALANRLASWPINAVISSDLQRCVQTAVPLAAPHNLQPVFTTHWRERHVGDFEGMTTEEVRARFPELWGNSPRRFVDPPNGEAFPQLRQRVLAAYETVLADYPHQMVAVVSHGGTLHTLIREVIGLDGEEYGRFSLRGNTGLSIIEVTDHGAYLTRLNDTSHLENGG
jgi:broad specificity phosphatase PhoE